MSTSESCSRVLDSRARITELEAMLIAERARRDELDDVAMPATRCVVDSVRGDRAEGPDGALYEAMGFVRESEIRRGLVRRVGRRGKEPREKRVVSRASSPMCVS